MVVVLGATAVAGTLGAVAGVVAGLISALKPRFAVVAAALALVAAVAFTLFEQPLSGAGVGGFAVNRPLASAAATIAGVFLFGVVVATAMDRHETEAWRLQLPSGRAAR